MDVVKVALIGALILGGIYCQFLLIRRDEEEGGPKRLIPAAVAGVIIILGVCAVSAIEVFDGRRSLPLSTAFANVGRALVLSLSLLAKSYLAPITVAFTLVCAAYFFLSYGELRAIPLIQSIFEWAFPKGKAFSWGYVALIVFYSLGASIHDGGIELG